MSMSTLNSLLRVNRLRLPIAQGPIKSLFHRIASQTTFGQPTWKTHSDLMRKGELTPGISFIEYELRRARLMMSLPPNSAVISLGYRTRFMSNKVFYPFHQNTDFYYLCGFNEPDSAMILEKDNSSRGYKMTMFVPPKNPEAELWDGPRTGLEGAIELFGADEAFESPRFKHRLKDYIGFYRNIYMDMPPISPSLLSGEVALVAINNGTASFKIRAALSWLASLVGLNGEKLMKKSVKPLSPLVQEMRLIKSDSELKLMRQSGEISGKAFIQAMKATNPSMTEHELYAKLDYECRIRGSEMLAYVPVVAGGINALTMHYVRNDMHLKDGDLVLVDCGGEHHGYASDITRTWPVNGKFTEPQKELYQAVLNVNKKCIKLCTEKANISLNGIHELSVRMMKEELCSLGFKLSEGDVDRTLYPHHVGHYLGLDVHDCHDMDRSRVLRQGYVVTIEPGVYVPCDDRFPHKYQGIGIRIEDNVWVGIDEPVVLSVTAPKELVDVEACCQRLLDS